VQTRDFLLEIGTEEIPARCIGQLAKSLADDLEKGFLSARLVFDNKEGSIQVFSSYRRLAIRISGLSEIQTDTTDVITGPPLAMAKNESGDWLPPALGFAKKVGIDPSALSTCIGKDAKGREVLTYTKEVTGESTVTVLSTLIPQILHALPLPVAMRWGDHEKTFYRPVQWVVCLFGTDVIPFSFFDVTSGRVSRGHRFLSANEEGSILGASCILEQPSDYLSALEKQFVFVDQDMRKAVIRKTLLDLGTMHPDWEMLLDEVVNLVECPTALIGSFSDAYLELPSEVLSKTMMSHQRYFPIFSDAGITNRFVIIAEHVSMKNQAAIISGNERVIIARLEDARFFFSEDKKTSLSAYTEGLKNVVFQKGMGSLFDKKERVKLLAKHCAQLLGYDDLETLEKVAELCKADLVTHMVYEFPELQGIMGSYYARLSGENEAVSQAIREHYYPLSSSSPIPSSDLARIVAIADRLDTIVVCYQNGLIPTGSKDPLGIRRAMISLLMISFSGGLHLDFPELFRKAYAVLGKGDANYETLLSFFIQRVQTFIEERSQSSYDIAQSVMEKGLSGLVVACETAQWLRYLKEEEPCDFKPLVEAAVRVKRLAKSSDPSVSVNPALFQDDIEKIVWASVLRLQEQTVDYSKFKNFKPLVALLSEYFEKILVMAEDESIKKNRLACLAAIDAQFSLFADFEKIVIGS